MKKLFLVLSCLGTFSCVKKILTDKVIIVMSDDVRLDKDQILVCPYIKEYNILRCMSPEEFEVRSQSEE